jgi:hypothetical protein
VVAVHARRDAAGPVDQATLAAGDLAEAGVDGGVELLPDARDAEEEGRLDLLEVVGDLLEGLGEVDADAEDGGAVDGEHLLGDVRQREVAEGAVLGGELVDLADGLDGPHAVAVAEHDGLRRAGGPGGVDVAGAVVALDLAGAVVDGVGRGGVAAGQEVVPREDHRVALDVGAAHQHDVLEARQVVALLHDLGVLLAVLDEDDGGLGVVDDVLRLARRAGGVDAGRDGADGHGAEGEDHPLEPVEAEDAGGLAVQDAEGDE